MKKIIIPAILLAVVIPLLFSQGNSEIQTETETVQKETPVKIGISKLVTHPALDSIEKGIQDYLNVNGYNAVFDEENANAEISTAMDIAQSFKDKKQDIVMGIATPTAQALATVYKNTDTPVIYCAITDPDAAGLTQTDGMNKNVCGVSDLNPIDLQIKTFQEVTNLKTLGMIYTSGEANGVAMKERAAQYCEANNIQFVPVSVINSAEVKTAALSIINRIDGLFIANDNTVVSALASVDQVCTAANIPLFNSDITSSYGTNFLMSWGLDYYKVGLTCGKVAGDIIDGKTPAELGSIFLTDITQFQLMINLDRAKELGLTIPQDILDNASITIQDGKVIQADA